MSYSDTTEWPLIGRRFGSRNQLLVVSGSADRDSRGSKLYHVVCDYCSKDSELFKSPFKCTSSIIKNNSEPCGCYKKTRYSEDQYLVKIRRVCVEKGIKFNGVVGEWNGVFTKLNVQCSNCGMTWKSISVGRLLNYNGACRSCTSREKGNKKTDGDLSSKFRLTGAYDDGYRFWREPSTLAYKEHNLTWYYTCPYCSSDEYVLNGLCTGVFKTRNSSLAVGQYACRCSKSYRWTKEQREHQLLVKIKEENLPYQFLGWVESYTGCSSKILLECDVHGIWPVSFKQFYTNGTGCPQCATSGFKLNKPAVFYVILAGNETTSESFCGYGITNDIETRLTTHKSKLKKCGYVVHDVELFHIDFGTTAKALEKEVMSKFPLSIQKVDGFKTEATDSFYFNDVVAFVDFKLNGE